MRSTDDFRTLRRTFLFLTSAMLCLVSAAAFSAGKVKPDLPIGEELEEAHTPKPAGTKVKPGKTAGAVKSGHAAPSSHQAEDKNSHSEAKEQKAREKDPHGKTATPNEEAKDPHATAPAQHGEESDPHASAPVQHGEDNSGHANPAGNTPVGAHGSAHGEEENRAADSQHNTPKNRLLEGKVDPALPPQGKGFVWFAVVFAVLAIAIFIFT